MFLIGNKVDLEESRLITKEQGLQLQKDFELDLFMETSAKIGFNTQELFVEAAKVLYEDYKKYRGKPKKTGEKLKMDKDDKNEAKQGCCKWLLLILMAQTEDNQNPPNEEDLSQKDYEILREDFPNYDLSFKVIVIGNSSNIIYLIIYIY